MSTTPNMNISLPTVGSTSGPTWATNLNTAFSTVDSHDHSSGKGVQVTPSGININADFPMVSNNITQARSVRFTAQNSPLALSTDLKCVYVSGADLYYNDANGNQVRITQSGNVAGSAGSISGLSSPASASYAAGVFTWQSAANTPATMDSGSVIIRELVANGKGCTLQTVAALASNYSIYLPQLPASTKMLIMDSSGNMTASYVTDNSTIEVSSNTLRIKDAGVTNAKMANNAINTAQIFDGAVTIAKGSTRTVGTSASAGYIAQRTYGSASVTSTSYASQGVISLVSTAKPVDLNLNIYGITVTTGTLDIEVVVTDTSPGGGAGTGNYFVYSLHASDGFSARLIVAGLTTGHTYQFDLKIRSSDGSASAMTSANLFAYEIF